MNDLPIIQGDLGGVLVTRTLTTTTTRFVDGEAKPSKTDNRSYQWFYADNVRRLEIVRLMDAAVQPTHEGDGDSWVNIDPEWNAPPEYQEYQQVPLSFARKFKRFPSGMWNFQYWYPKPAMRRVMSQMCGKHWYVGERHTEDYIEHTLTSPILDDTRIEFNFKMVRVV